MEGADIYQVAKNCRTSGEMIEKHYSAQIKNTFEASAINIMRSKAVRTAKRQVKNGTKAVGAARPSTRRPEGVAHNGKHRDEERVRPADRTPGALTTEILTQPLRLLSHRQIRLAAGAFARLQTFNASLVITMHPVAQSLPVHAI